MSTKVKKLPDSIEDIIERCGHKLHFDMVSILEKQGWEFEISPYYIDDFSKAPREIDIMAKRSFPYISAADNEEKKVNLILGIECKYITQNVVIWNSENKLKTKALFSNIPRVWDIVNDGTGYFHYSNSFDVGQLIAEGDGKSGFQEGILQAIKGTLDIYFRGGNGNSIFLPVLIYELGKDVKISTILETNTNTTKTLSENWIHHINYAYVDRNTGKRCQQQFYVDLIEREKFIDFTQKLENEGKAIADFLQAQTLKLRR